MVFINETWAYTNMAGRHGRAPRGQRLRVGVPHARWLTTTFVAGLSTRGIIAPFVLDGPINRKAFETYVREQNSGCLPVVLSSKAFPKAIGSPHAPCKRTGQGRVRAPVSAYDGG